MNLQKSENPASVPVFHLNADPEARPGGRWTDRQLSFGLQARDAPHLTYVFYEWEAQAYPGFMGEPWLHIRLDHQSFCFGNWWGWKIQFDPGCNLPKRLAYAIQVEKKGNQSNWVLDPFSRGLYRRRILESSSVFSNRTGFIQNSADKPFNWASF